MRLVIDSNRLRSDELRQFLAKSRSSFAVLTDYAGFEAYSDDTLQSICKSMKVLAEFPNQVLVLKNSPTLCEMSGRGKGLQKRLIDKATTKEFPEFIRFLRRALEGDKKCEAELLARGRISKKHLETMLKDSETTGALFESIANDFSPKEKLNLKDELAFKPELTEKILDGVFKVSNEVFFKRRRFKVNFDNNEYFNTYIFRYSLCMYLMILDWVASGGAGDANPKKLRNDQIDVSFAAIGTYFNGLMTSDRKAAVIHAQARVWLSKVFGCSISGIGGVR